MPDEALAEHLARIDVPWLQEHLRDEHGVARSTAAWSSLSLLKRHIEEHLDDNQPDDPVYDINRHWHGTNCHTHVANPAHVHVGAGGHWEQPSSYEKLGTPQEDVVQIASAVLSETAINSLTHWHGKHFHSHEKDANGHTHTDFGYEEIDEPSEDWLIPALDNSCRDKRRDIIRATSLIQPGKEGFYLCPVPSCGAPLYQNIEASIPMAMDNYPLNDTKSAVTSTWEVACENGHVVLKPVGFDPPEHLELIDLLSAWTL